MYQKIIPFLVDYIVKRVILTPKSQRLSQHSEIFCQILMVHYQEIKNTKTFCINQKITLGQIWGHISYINVTALLILTGFL